MIAAQTAVAIVPTMNMDRIKGLADTGRSRKGKVLAIVTSHDRLGDTGYATGYWMPELAYPYLALTRAGYQVEVASPRGGKAPLDPYSDPSSPVTQNPDDFVCTGLLTNRGHNGKLENTFKLSEILPTAYVGAWLVGGYGAAFEFGGDEEIPRILGALWDAGGVVGAVSHGAHGLLNVKTSNGRLLISGRDVTGFAKSEDEAVERAVGAHFLPSYLEDELRARGARYRCAPLFQPFAITSEDGRLVTGQQLFSADIFAKQFTEALERVWEAIIVSPDAL